MASASPVNIEEQLRALGATDEWIAEDERGDKWYVNYHEDGYTLTKMASDVYFSRPVCQHLPPLPGLRLWMTRDQYREYTKRLESGQGAGNA